MYIYGGMNHEDQLLGDLSAFKFNGQFISRCCVLGRNEPSVEKMDTMLINLFFFTIERRWLTYPDTLESAPPRTEHAMCNVGDKVYILGGQLELNADDDAGSVYILDTSELVVHRYFYLFFPLTTRHLTPSFIASHFSSQDPV